MWRLFCAGAMSLVFATCGGGQKTSGNPAAPSTPQNRAPTLTAMTVSPQGTGLLAATIFTLLAQGVSDPDGDALTYSWNFGDGDTRTTESQAVSHVYMRSGNFQVQFTVTDAKGLATSATASVRVGTVTGTWDVTCEYTSREFPNFPHQFVATLSQSGRNLTGSLAAAGRSRYISEYGGVGDPRRMSFGVETADNVWASRDGDFYFTLDLDDTLTSGTGRAQYCQSSIARKR